MVTRFGMSAEIGLLALDRAEEGNYLDGGVAGGVTRPYSDETALVIDQATRRIVDECYTKALDLLTRERQRLESLAEALLREESLNEAQMRAATGLEDRAAPLAEVAATR
jgi:cell division protease FtsH